MADEHTLGVNQVTFLHVSILSIHHDTHKCAKKLLKLYLQYIASFPYQTLLRAKDMNYERKEVKYQAHI